MTFILSCHIFSSQFFVVFVNGLRSHCFVQAAVIPPGSFSGDPIGHSFLWKNFLPILTARASQVIDYVLPAWQRYPEGGNVLGSCPEASPLVWLLSPCGRGWAEVSPSLLEMSPMCWRICTLVITLLPGGPWTSHSFISVPEFCL